MFIIRELESIMVIFPSFARILFICSGIKSTFAMDAEVFCRGAKIAILLH